METGDYETNTLILNNISAISYRFYEPSTEPHNFPSAALDIERALRDEGHVVSYDPARKGIWYFQFLRKDGAQHREHNNLGSLIEYGLHHLSSTEEGMIEPQTLQKARSQMLPSTNTPTSSSSTGSNLDFSQRQGQMPTSQSSICTSQDADTKNLMGSGVESRAASTLQRVLYENFIAALLLTITATFCHQGDAIPLNYRTVLFPAGASALSDSQDLATEKFPILGTFKAFLTTTGTLVLSLTVTQCKGLLSLEDFVVSGAQSSSRRILAAPFGALASSQFSVPLEGLASLAQTPNSQALSMRAGPEAQDSLWKQACSKYLCFRGVPPSTLSNCNWINLMVSRSRVLEPKIDHRITTAVSSVTLTWPGRLCFRKRPIDVSSSRVVDTVLTGHEESHDPLGSAKGWFNSATDRDEKVSKRVNSRGTAVQKEASLIDARLTKPSAHSPMELRRPSTATAGIMYPTPPDGIQPPTGVTPSMDGTFSSPGNPLSVPPVVDAEPIALNTDSTSGDVDESPQFAEPKRPQNDNSLLNDADNMFPDMGGDMFDDNDITEADFNFFDEAPGNMDLDLSLGDITSSNNVALSVPKVEEESSHPIEELTPQPITMADKVVFTKPDPKHARSRQIDEASQRNRAERATSTKRESSPFDPHTVFKRVRASLKMAGQAHNATKPTQISRRKSKIFDTVDFDSTLPMINKKYEQGGTFDFTRMADSETPKLDMTTLPETDYLKRHNKANRKAKERQPSIMPIMKTFTGLETTGMDGSPAKLDGSISEAEDSSLESDQDDSSYTTDDPLSPQKTSIKLTNVEDDAMSHATFFKEPEVMEETDHQLAVQLPRLSKPHILEMPLSTLFSDPEPLALDITLPDEDMIQVAQILTEQAATGTLDICNLSDDSLAILPSQKRRALSSNTRNAFHLLEGIVSHFMGDMAATRLKSLLDIQDMPLLGQPSRIQARPITGRDPNLEQMRASNLYQIPSPHLEVRRADMKLSVLPSAIAFWESLGLAPTSGSKTINAVCVFPGWTGMADNVRTFLGRIKSVYEYLKLGSFENLPLSADFDDGILPYDVDRISTSPDATLTGHGSAIIERTEVLSTAFSKADTLERNVVIYFVYSPNNPGTIVEACIAFQQFSNHYQNVIAAKKEDAQNELVLQLVSSDILSSPTSIVITPSPELFKLCIETYDRCMLFTGSSPSPAIRLDQTPPRVIDFKLTPTPSAALLRENSCIHVSYAQSVDDRWVSAAWTDDRGNQQATASYCLGRKGKPASRSMNEVANEIWETTLELISTWKVFWRIIITKCGPMPPEEADYWVELSKPESPLAVGMVLFTVDTNPSLQLLPPAVRLPSSSTAFYTTPVSTPQANIVSPEQTTTPATPAREGHAATPGADGSDADSEALLADLTDQTWGSVVGHRLSNSTSVLELHPAIISGYLIKRTGTRLEDAPVVMEINLIHAESNPRTYEPLLREMLSTFRALGTLTRARGMVDREADVRPWHIAAAEKAVRALYLLM